jgi:DMSO/TMAO reductase YedYZ molybdopterin-dependent catalytic subunit
MYAYKSVKWVERIVFTEKQELGYWEKSGYPLDGAIPDLES